VGSGVPVLGEEIGFFGLCAQTVQRSERVQIPSQITKPGVSGNGFYCFGPPKEYKEERM